MAKLGRKRKALKAKEKKARQMLKAKMEKIKD